MNTVQSLDELLDLAHKHVGVCVSLYMPTYRKGAETQQNQIRFKNLIRDAENQLMQRDLRPSETRELLSPAQELMNNELFWRNQKQGFALFLSPDSFHSFKSPDSFDELVVVAERFHLKPLIRIMARDIVFFILAVSLRNIRLFECTRRQQKEIPLEGIPRGLSEALDLDDFEKRLQLHTGSEDTKAQALKFFQQVDRGLQEYLRDRRDALIFAGVEYLFPIYREANTYPRLLETTISGNPEGLSADELHGLAMPLVEAILQEKENDALSQYRKSAGTGLASRDLREIIQAAHHGRIGILFVAHGVQEWGVFDEDNGRIHMTEPNDPISEDLLDFAAIRTLLNGGTVHVFDPSSVPGGGPIAAVFRY
ncbi:MAG: hypothetical protein AVO39_03895 [delta proteobacterium MLS_D]|jgi:hypothetical protein|nr:MAG: hypothetical protein AVO39_03895 [delta proteobacterium MLS_D]